MIRPQIGGNDAGVAADLGGRAFGQLAPGIHRHDPLGETHHEVHVVLDDDDGGAALVADAADDAGERGRFARRHADRRLVEQHEMRARRQRHRDHRQPLLGVGEGRTDGAAAPGQSD